MNIAIKYRTDPYRAIKYKTEPHNVIKYSTEPYSVIKYSTEPYSTLDQVHYAYQMFLPAGQNKAAVESQNSLQEL